MKRISKIVLILFIVLTMKTIFTPAEHACTLHAEDEAIEQGITTELPDSIKVNEKPSKSIAQVNLERCIKCGLCASVCPVKAIQMIEHKPVIDPYLCTGCKTCVQQCPTKALEMTVFYPADSICAEVKEETPSPPCHRRVGAPR